MLKGLIAAALLAVKGLIIAGLTRDLNIMFIKVDCEEKKEKERKKREKCGVYLKGRNLDLFALVIT